MGNRVRRAALPIPFVVPPFGTDSKSYGKAKLHFKWFRTIHELVLESELVNFFGFLSKFLYIMLHSLQAFFFAPRCAEFQCSEGQRTHRTTKETEKSSRYRMIPKRGIPNEHTGKCRCYLPECQVYVCVLCVVYSLAQNDCQTYGVFRV